MRCAGLLDVLGIAPLRGRALDESAADETGAALVSASFAQARFGAAEALGQTLRIEGRTRRIVGVVPDDIGILVGAQIWLPLAPTPEDLARRGDRRLNVFGRLAPGATLDDANAELARIAGELATTYPDSNAGWSVAAEPVRARLVDGDERTRLWVLAAAVGLLLLVTCSNLAGLQLARAARRQHELGVRQALGADRRRLRADLLAESLLLVLAGSLLALPLAASALHVAATTLADGQSRFVALSLDLPLAAIAIGICAGVVLLCSLVPAALSARVAPATALGNARSALGQRGTPLRNALVVAQFAFATVLLGGAGLLGARLWELAQADLGFRSEQVLTARISLPPITEPAVLEAQQRRLDALVARLASSPGVLAAAASSEAPLGDLDTQSEIGPGPQPLDASPAERRVQASWRIVGADYFEVLGMPLLHGRVFRADEAGDSVILGRNVAERLFGRVDVVDRVVTLANGQRRRVVGVVADAYQRGLADGPSPTVYYPTTWWLWDSMAVMLRASGEPDAVLAQLREAVRAEFPDRPLYDVRTLSALVERSSAGERLQAKVVLLFAVLSALIAAVGVGAITAFRIASRRGELALRLALGASPARLRWRALGEAAGLAALGMALGAALLLALPLSALIGAAPALPAPTLLLGVILLLGVVCLAACWRPAARVVGMDPAHALRGE
jgi:predicted permease